jgi:hypothetical protein
MSSFLDFKYLFAINGVYKSSIDPRPSRQPNDSDRPNI